MANYKVKTNTTIYDERYPYNAAAPEAEQPEVMALENLVVKVYQHTNMTADDEPPRVWVEVEDSRAAIGDFTAYWSTSTFSQGMSGYYYRSYNGRTLVIITNRLNSLSELPVTIGTEEERLSRFGDIKWSEVKNFKTYILGQILLK